MLKEVYGEFIVNKDSILYHSSEEPFSIKSEKDKPMLFCTFHPSEYGMMGDYLTLIKLKKSVSLFFMIDDFKKARINCALKTLTNNPNANLAKKHKDQLIIFSNELKKTGFNGWFSSINDTSVNIEIALFNDKSLYEFIGSNELILNWNNWNGNNKYFNIGNSYKISTLTYPIILIINDDNCCSIDINIFIFSL